MKFVDYVTITVRSGSGGPGAVAFRREKFVPRGGPSGGDGGDGGSIYLEAAGNLYTLLDLRYNRHHFAQKGQHGAGSNKKGKDGLDIVLLVPPGTVARRADTKEVIGELVKSGDRLLLAQGGRGGKGNAFFKTATNQAPRFAQPGEEGEELDVTLELKLLADVGLVGLPNAGKSTLISSISAARPKIADYPFTTLEPNLGMVYLEEYRSFVMADIPGIIEGAHEGKGLGIRFLRHIERNAVLLFVIPVSSPSPVEEYEVLLRELEAFSPDLLEKPRMIAISKADLFPQEELDLSRPSPLLEKVSGFPEGTPVLVVSAVAGIGLNTLKEALWKEIQEHRSEAAE